MEELDLSDLAYVAGTMKHCVNATSMIFLRRFAAQQIEISTRDPAQLNILNYFGPLIKSFRFNFVHTNNCSTNQTFKYRRLLQYANQYREFVGDFEIIGKLCDLNLFDEIVGPFDAKNVIIFQTDVTIAKANLRLCQIFPNVRKLQLTLMNLNNPTFIDCEFELLDELIIGGKLLERKFNETFKNLLRQNTRIQRITFECPPNHRTFQLIKKYLKSVQEVQILGTMHENDDSDSDSDTQEEIFLPSVRKLELHQQFGTECQLPMAVIFGGLELQELSLICSENERNYNYFSTLYRYPNIKSLNAGLEINNRDLLKMVGKFPRLTKANFSFSDGVQSETIVKFIEKCNQLTELSFVVSNKMVHEELESMVKQFETSISKKFIIDVEMQSKHFRLERSESSASKFVTSGVIILLIVMHSCRAIFYQFVECEG